MAILIGNDGYQTSDRDGPSSATCPPTWIAALCD
jgi:hypothetical protein